jgi:hypothetical protein
MLVAEHADQPLLEPVPRRIILGLGAGVAMGFFAVRLGAGVAHRAVTVT